MHVRKTLEAAILSEEAAGKQLSVTGLKWFAVVIGIHKSNRIKQLLHSFFKLSGPPRLNPDTVISHTFLGDTC